MQHNSLCQLPLKKNETAETFAHAFDGGMKSSVQRLKQESDVALSINYMPALKMLINA